MSLQPAGRPDPDDPVRERYEDSGKPGGIYVVCLLTVVGALFWANAGIAAVGAAGGQLPGWLALVGLAVLGLALVNLVVAYGLVTLRYWGWLLALVTYGLDLLLNGLLYLGGDPTTLFTLPLVVVLFLYVFGKGDVYREARSETGGRGRFRSRRLDE